MQNINYLYNSLKEETMRALTRSYRADNMVEHYSVWENATILPAKTIYIPSRCWVGGCVDSENNLIEETIIPCLMGWKYDIPEVSKEYPIAIYLGYMFSCYGHMLGDCLRWAWFLQSEEYHQFKRSGAKLLYISMAPLESWQEEILRLAGITNVELVTEPVKVKKLIVPTPSIVTDDKEQNYWRPEFLKTINLMIENAYKSAKRQLNYDKIYLSRCGIGDIMGESNVEQFYHKHGFKIIRPEHLTVAEQIVLLNNAKEVVATEGSLSHNTIFCKTKTKVFLLRRSLHLNKYSLFINEMCDLDVQYIDCSLALFTQKSIWWDRPFYIYVSEAIAHSLKTKAPIFPLRSFKQYMKICLAEPDFASRVMNVEEDYAILIQKEIEKLRQRNENIINKLFKHIPYLKHKQAILLRRLNNWIIEM
ncbi:MAG: glycosyltransferase family 61 protein [Paludibacteraceae bacterium]|nr:glycosyltransferase family 61 protein [Paludibacteraceae bacterium]